MSEQRYFSSFLGLSNKNICYKNYIAIFWIQKTYIDTLYYSIVPKILTWIGRESSINLENYINQNNPYSNLNYANEETYLIAHKITYKDVIKNSITYVLKDISQNDIEYLAQSFLALVKNKKVKVLNANTENEKALYSEIISYLEYVSQIQKILQEGYSDKKGTAFRTSSLKKIIETRISKLQDRLDDSLTPISSKEEIGKLKHIIKMLKKSQENNYKNLFEYFNIMNSFFGLDIPLLELSDTERIAIEQALNFYNGARCSDIELIRSSMIFLNMLFNNTSNNSQKYAESILDITMHFFSDKMNEINTKDNQLTFTKEHTNKSYALKTTIDKTFIFIYSRKDSPLDELLDIAVKSLSGIENPLAVGEKNLENISDYTVVKNILKVLKNEMNLNKMDIKVMRYFLAQIEKGNFPLPHFVQ